jgi:hypothetical protein
MAGKKGVRKENEIGTHPLLWLRSRSVPDQLPLTVTMTFKCLSTPSYLGITLSLLFLRSLLRQFRRLFGCFFF